MENIEFLISQIVLIVLGIFTLTGTIINGFIEINNPIMNEKRAIIKSLRNELIILKKNLSSHDMAIIPIDTFGYYYKSIFETFEKYRPYLWEIHKNSLDHSLNELMELDCSMNNVNTSSIEPIYKKAVVFLRQFLDYSDQELSSLNKVPLFMKRAK